MDIEKQIDGDLARIKIRGRLDAYWSDHLTTELTDVIRSGIHHIVMDLSDLNYISSAGIRVFLNLYRQMSAIEGSFYVSEFSPTAASILEMAGLKDLLAAVPPPVSARVPEWKEVETEQAKFAVFTLNSKASIKCKAFGDPQLLHGCRYRESDSQRINFPGSTFGIGLGAFGDSFGETKNRFGEFVAVAGSALYQPSDGTNTPDFLVSSGTMVPHVLALYGIRCSADFSHLLRFHSKNEVAVPFSHLVSESLTAMNAESAGIVLIAETTGILGASLIQPPVIEASQDVPFSYPITVEWLSFSAERIFSRSVCLVAGIASRQQNFLPAFVRPILKKSELYGHFHAAAFPYRPLQKGKLDLSKAVSTLFESDSVYGVTHLLNDDREIGGAGESEFVRGALWTGPISGVEA